MEDFDKPYQALWNELDDNTAGRVLALKQNNEILVLERATQRVEIIKRMAEHARRAFHAYSASESLYRTCMWERRAIIHEAGEITGIWNGKDEFVLARNRQSSIFAAVPLEAAS